MKRSEIEHLVAAAADIVDDEIVVIGSQAVLGEHPDAPATLLVSIEADVYPRTRPDRADEIDGAIGHGSRFHETYGYYAHGVGPETAVAPRGWELRLIRVDVPAHKRGKTATAWFMSMHDLLLAKLAAGREHDRDFVETALREGLATVPDLELGLDVMPDDVRETTGKRLGSIALRLKMTRP